MDERERENDVSEEFESTGQAHTEDTELEDVEEYSEQKIRTLREKLTQCEKERMAHLEDLQRTKADFLNSKKRLETQLERDRERITENHIAALLPLADSFDMAISDPAWQQTDERWRKGIEGIRAQLAAILKGSGVESIEAVGVPFDPNTHEAVSHQDGGNTVTDVLQKGYRIGERVIRPARVAVG